MSTVGHRYTSRYDHVTLNTTSSTAQTWTAGNCEFDTTRPTKWKTIRVTLTGKYDMTPMYADLKAGGTDSRVTAISRLVTGQGKTVFLLRNRPSADWEIYSADTNIVTLVYEGANAPGDQVIQKLEVWFDELPRDVSAP